MSLPLHANLNSYSKTNYGNQPKSIKNKITLLQNNISNHLKNKRNIIETVKIHRKNNGYFNKITYINKPSGNLLSSSPKQLPIL